MTARCGRLWRLEFAAQASDSDPCRGTLIASAIRSIWRQCPDDPDVGELFARALMFCHAWYCFCQSMCCMSIWYPLRLSLERNEFA